MLDLTLMVTLMVTLMANGMRSDVARDSNPMGFGYRLNPS